jgi:hypothetical protein
MTSIPFAFKALALSVIASVGEGLTKDIRGDSKAALIELSKKDGTILNEYNLRQEPAMLSLRVVKPSKKTQITRATWYRAKKLRRKHHDV